ncbi:glycogen synthase [Patescibacteria group bacterium]|nr:glycogen synthase [Patescibacteria group bacterium]MBU1921871.1 glycogen synthase [Patescibacteria group bacterium]
MAKKTLKIVHVASEVHPFSKTGGLADVVRSLPKALRRLGHEVIVITPFYGQVLDKKKYHLKEIGHDINIKIDKDNALKVIFWQGWLMEGLPIYFIENEKYFSRRKALYGSTHENARFLLFNIAALKLLIHIKFAPDIIQCHDWQTGMIPQLIKKGFDKNQYLSKAATIFTIHNLAFQMGMDWWKVPLARKDFGVKKIPAFDDPRLEYINFAKRGILNADVISTVSESYAQEIMTPRFGQDLHRILSNRSDRLFGIINGIDYFDYNPVTDPGLHKNFSFKSPERKAVNKAYIQKHFGLRQEPRAALLVMTSRVAEQKGFDLLAQILDMLMRMNLQLVIMGDGDKKYISILNKYHKEHAKRMVWSPFERKRETSLYAAADMVLLPSRFEPCGLVQMKSSRYGAVPIARDIGGLSDTISDYNPRTGRGNGFEFKKYNAQDFLVAITRALTEYEHEENWKELVRHVMQMSTSWAIPATKYVTLYRSAIKLKEKNGKK